MKAVIDTNVVFAGLVNRKGAPFKIFQHFFQRKFEWINSQPILDEYLGVLTLSQKISPISVHIFLNLLDKNSTAVEIPNKLQVCKDSDDDKFLETAVTARADYLVTKNLRHFPRKSYEGIRIVAVSKFLTELEKLST